MDKTLIEGVDFLFHKFKSLFNISFEPLNSNFILVLEVEVLIIVKELVMRALHRHNHSVLVEDIKELLLVLCVIDATLRPISNSLVVVFLISHLPVLDVLSNCFFIVILREVKRGVQGRTWKY